MPQELALVVTIMLLFFLFLVVVSLALLARPWFRAALYGTPIPLIRIVAMRLRGNPPMLIVESYIALKRSGVETTIGEVENKYIDSRNRIRSAADLVELVKNEHVAKSRAPHSHSVES